MDYEQARPLIRSGDLLAFSHGGWSSWREIKVNIVRMATRSTYSHVGIAWVTAGRVFVIEAVIPKIRITPLSKEGDFYLVPMGADWTLEAEEFALSKVGAEYSQWDAIKAFFRELKPGTVSQCAAFAREVYYYMGIYLGRMSRPDTVVFAALDLGKELIFINNGGKYNE